MGDFTVRETLRYVALFQLGYVEAVPELVNEIIAKVGLTSCADSKIGSVFFKGISGGQQRRLALAMELVKNPSIIFLDEPLTNLDATAAYQIVLQLQKLARHQHTIVFSAHTPSSRLLEAFDELVVLSRGRVTYFGKASRLAEYLESIGKPVPELFNPCDHLMHLAISDAEYIETAFAQSPIKLDISRDVDKILADRTVRDMVALPAGDFVSRNGRKRTSRFSSSRKVSNLNNLDDIDDVNVDRPSTLSRVTTLVQRASVAVFYNPGVFFIRLAFFSVVGLFIGATFIGVCSGTSYTDVHSCISLLIGALIMYPFLGILSVPFIIDDAYVYAREKHNGAYTSLAFTVTMVLRSLIFTAAFALLASLFTVYMGHLDNLALYFVAVWSLLMFAEAYSILWSMLTRDYLVTIVVFMGKFVVSGGN